ncbi:MAG: alpha/beta hydrolase [Candidatus Binataceae bacterium]
MSQQQLQSLIQMFKSQPQNPNATVQESRAGFEMIAGMFPVEADIKCEPLNVSGVKSECVSAPDADAGRAILYLHGGGYVIGSINTHRSLAGRLSRAAKARVLLIDYRLAPENPHPAAVDDALAAYRWMLQQGLKPSRIAVAGDSAGGGLTMATLVAIRDAKLPLPAAGVPMSPWVDLEGIGESMTSKAAADPIVQKSGLLNMAAAYLNGQNPRTPLAAPLYADLAGLPPLLIQVGTAETLLDDASRLAERAKKAGVNVTYEPWENMIHVWQLFAPMLDEGQQAIDKVGAFVRKHAA